MRQVEERGSWDKYDKAIPSDPIRIDLSGGTSVEFRQSCTVVAGRNGAGKSRLLRTAADQLGESALLVELHYLTQKVLDVTRSRDDFEEMTEEFSPVGADADQMDDLRRVVGRDYASADWFALDMELTEEFDPGSFYWGSEQTTVPYFRVEYRDARYSSTDMGLGEFAVHLLFWILNQYRDRTDVVLLLDEPDAFLPPVAASALLARLLTICRKRNWRVVLTTHSDELIRAAVSRGALILLSRDADGRVTAEYSDDDPNIAEHLLTKSPIDNVVFCEDESAWHLTNELLRHHDRNLWKSTSIVWGKGEAGLRALNTHLPKPPDAAVRFAVVFDGDQQGNPPEELDSHWPFCFLPTAQDPDALFKSLRESPEQLAAELSRPAEELRRLLDSIEALDQHDWVNKIGEMYGRQIGLSALARLWVRTHPTEAESFVKDLLRRW